MIDGAKIKTMANLSGPQTVHCLGAESIRNTLIVFFCGWRLGGGRWFILPILIGGRFDTVIEK